MFDAPRCALKRHGHERTILFYALAMCEATHAEVMGATEVTDTAKARAQACRLAGEISSYRPACPGTPIYVIAHSAGSRVALESTRWLPPDSVDRIILLAPAVSADYDLRPGLGTARWSVDVFTSRRDRFILGLGTALVGTADAKFATPLPRPARFHPPPL